MATTTFTVGRLVLREDRLVSEAVDASGKRSMSLSGQESRPRLSAAQVRTQREDILGLRGAFVPIVFTRQPTLTGYYSVEDVSGEIHDIGGGLVMFRWEIDVARVGTVSEVDLESRLSGAQTRANNFAATGERSHAPALGAVGYWAGSAAPGAVDRPCADGGSIRVYRSVPTAAHPRWTVDPEGYLGGRVRFMDMNGQERTGTSFRVDPVTGWELSNGVLRVRPAVSATLEVAVWSGVAWEAISWIIRMDNPWVSLLTFDELSVLQNEPESVVIRLFKSHAPGRTYIDLTLRRGARLVEVYVSTSFSTRLGIVRETGVASTATSGYVVATADDAAGNRSVVGSALTFTADTVNGGIEKTATLTLDAMIGSVFNGGTAVAGDTAAHLYAQYLGMPGEMVRGVRR